ncbi:hypothetical protein [Streptomyces sp. NPDC057702]|uniref:hypothetical protein n=1 Tax=unclassified Streptomyces TaxID=2593676 RepID=UPI00369F799F
MPPSDPPQATPPPAQPGYGYGYGQQADPATPAYGQGAQPGPAPYGQPPQGEPPTPYGQQPGPYGTPRQPDPYGQPARPGPYGQPQQPGPYAHSGPYGAPQPGPYAPGQPPYGGYPTPPDGGRGRRRTALVVGGVVAALVVISGGVYLATRDGDDGDKKPVAQRSESVSPTPTLEPSPTPDDASTGDSASPGPSLPDPTGLTPTGTGIEGVWRSTKDGRMLAMAKGGLSTGVKGRDGAALVKGDLECKGLREERTPGKTWRLALLCERGGEQDKNLGGDVTLSGDTVTVVWDTEGTETFERFKDLTES